MPEGFGDLSSLQKLDMFHCARVTSLPASELRHSESFYFLMFDVQRLRRSQQPEGSKLDGLLQVGESSCK